MFTGSDWALYIGLTVVGAVCVALGAALARGARKGRRLPPYSMARTGKLLSFYKILRRIKNVQMNIKLPYECV